MVQQVLLRWAANGGAGGVSVLHASDIAVPADIQLSITAFLNALKPNLCTGTVVTTEPTVRKIGTADGVLTGLGSLPSPPTATGTGGSSAVPNLAQGLIRLRTNNVVNGRFLQGRIFVPGLSSNTMLSTGELNPTGVLALAGAGQALVDSGVWGIWHRPVGGVGGVFSALSASSGWNEYASQRRRRS